MVGSAELQNQIQARLLIEIERFHETRVKTFSCLFAQTGSRLLGQMDLILFVRVAEVFQQLGVRRQDVVDADRERFGVGLGIVNGHLDFHVSEIPSRESLHEMQRFATRMPHYVERGSVIKANCVDHQRLPLPSADGVTEPGRLGIHR
jgi:hypothetical protein